MNIMQNTIHFKVPRISKLDEFFSPEIKIYDIPWQVGVKKYIHRAEPSLAVYLLCTQSNVSTKWTQVASASIQLVSFRRNEDSVHAHISPSIFDNSRMGSGKCSFIKWCDLFDETKNYVKDDAIILDIKIMAENPKLREKSKMKFEAIYRCRRKKGLAEYRLNITNIKNLLAVRSPRFIFRGIDWYFTVFKDGSNGLGLRLSNKKTSKEFIIQMNMAIKLVSIRPEKYPIEKNRTKRIGYNMYFIMNNLVSWEELLKPENGFVQNNSITIKVKLNDNIITRSNWNERNRKASKTSTEAKFRKLECRICSGVFGNTDVSFTPCGHMFCFDCIVDAISRCNQCPSCKSTVTLNQITKIK